MFTTPQLLILIAAIIGSGSMVGILAWMASRIRALESHDSSLLLEQIEVLRSELEAVGHSVASLEERTDFTEKLLTSGSGSDARSEHLPPSSTNPATGPTP